MTKDFLIKNKEILPEEINDLIKRRINSLFEIFTYRRLSDVETDYLEKFGISFLYDGSNYKLIGNGELLIELLKEEEPDWKSFDDKFDNILIDYLEINFNYSELNNLN